MEVLRTATAVTAMTAALLNFYTATSPATEVQQPPIFVETQVPAEYIRTQEQSDSDVSKTEEAQETGRKAAPSAGPGGDQDLHLYAEYKSMDHAEFLAKYSKEIAQMGIDPKTDPEVLSFLLYVLENLE